MKKWYKFFSIFILVSMLITIASSSNPWINLPAAKAADLDIDSTIAEGLAYIGGTINPDGGIPWIDETSSPAATLRVVIALAAAGYPQTYLASDTGNSPVDFLQRTAKDWINQVEAEESGLSIARTGQLLTAAAAANRNPRQFGEDELDLIATINTSYDANTGVYGNATEENVLDQVWAIIGLAANNESIPLAAAEWLGKAQLEDGSWNDGWGSYLDTTPLGMMALMASGHREAGSEEILSAVDFMMVAQQSNGGWQTEWDTNTNANTTGGMLQAISMLGQLPMDENWQKTEGNPLTATAAIQKDNGVIGGEYANAYSTADAIIGLSGQHMTHLGLIKRLNQAFTFLSEAQESDGSWGGKMTQTLYIMQAIKAAGWEPNSFVKDAPPLDFLAANMTEYVLEGPDNIGLAILGLIAAGEDPTDFAGVALIENLMIKYNSTTGTFGSAGSTWDQAMAILGLSAAGEEIPEAAVETLKNLQMENGGWEFSTGDGTYAESTAVAIQALLAAGLSPEDDIIKAGLEFITSEQLEDGSWGEVGATAEVVMALNALGQPVNTWMSDTGRSPVDNILSFQKNNGAYIDSLDHPLNNLLTTATALLALFGGDYILQPGEDGMMNDAALMIDPAEEGELQTFCISFEEESISGLELLNLADIEVDAPEGFVNSIAGISNPDGGTMYWSYWYWNGREWKFHETGAGETMVLPGLIEAWYFVSWETFPSPAPSHLPQLTTICGEDALKHYASQPFLSFNDINPEFTTNMETMEEEPAVTEPTETIQETEATEDIETPAEVTETELPPTEESLTEIPIEETEQSEAIESEQSSLPLIIIAVVGAAVVIAVILVIRRKAA
jgi:prenyltransferase beta subunit